MVFLIFLIVLEKELLVDGTLEVEDLSVTVVADTDALALVGC